VQDVLNHYGIKFEVVRNYKDGMLKMQTGQYYAVRVICGPVLERFLMVEIPISLINSSGVSMFSGGVEVRLFGGPTTILLYSNATND
jgi:hypothetical protein